MMSDSKDPDWLDALSDGSIFRHALALFGQMFLGILYFMLIFAGYATAISLSFILIGIPLLLFTLASTRHLADIDRRMMAAVLNIETPRTPDDVDMVGANLGQRLGMLVGSGLTWRSLIYLLLKLPIGIATFSALMLILPLMALEVLILAPLTIDLHLITVRMVRWLAMGSYHATNWLLPVLPSETTVKRKRERAENRQENVLEDDDAEGIELLEDDEPNNARYYIDSEGELQMSKRRRV